MTMNKIKILLYTLLGTMLLATACQDDDHELGDKLDPSEIDFDVVQDLTADPGGNTVILTNSTPGTVSMWDYGTGRSTRAQDTVHFAFEGDYVIKFSALTAGGVVELEPVTVHVTANNLSYVSGDLWTYLTGGVGHEKTWVLDYGKHGIFDGPLSYYEPQTTWTEMQNGTAKLGWAPSWSDNQWIIPEADKASTMTFSLIGGPYMKTHKVTEAVDESGTYYLDVDKKTISTTNATILRSASFIPNASNWNNNLVVLSLTENQLQVGVRRTNSEGDYLYVWNFISKEYADNYVPPVVPDPNFNFGDQADILTGGATKMWRLDTQVPFNWFTLNAVSLNETWTSRAAIMANASWTGFDDADVETFDAASITFSADGTVVVKQDNGTSASGTYTIDEPTNMITFSGITPSIVIADWIVAEPTADKQWKIIKIEKSSTTNEVVGIWFGKRNPDKAEYMAFHFLVK